MKKNNILTYAWIILLVFVFIITLTKVYDKGVYDGLKIICGDSDIGINDYDQIVCYDKEEQSNYYTGGEFNWS